MKANRSACVIAAFLDLFGDKWTLLIIRDMLVYEKRTFQDFQQSDEKIATNILSNRLKNLQTMGLVEKRAYQDRPVRYEYVPTQKMEDLRPLLREMRDWVLLNIPNTYDSTGTSTIKISESA